MKLPDLIRGLCDHLKLDLLEPDDDGVYALVFDDELDIEILAISGSQVLVRSRLGNVPDDPQQQESYYRKHLQHNLAHLKQQLSSLSVDREEGVLWIHRLARIDELDIRAFCELVEEVANAADWWQGVEAPHIPSVMMPMNMIRP